MPQIIIILELAKIIIRKTSHKNNSQSLLKLNQNLDKLLKALYVLQVLTANVKPKNTYLLLSERRL